MSDRKALAREIAARSKPRFVEIKPERSRGPFHTANQEKAILRSQEEYRWRLIRTYLDKA
jgi:hypothetical protein